MGRNAVFVVAVAALGLMGASAAKADSITIVRSGVGFSSNDSVSWSSLSGNVAKGTTVNSTTGIGTTITFPRVGSKGGSAAVECPASGCTWNGNFAGGEALLTNTRSGVGQGGMDLSFSQGIASVGFQIQPFDFGTFRYIVRAFDGASILGTWFGLGFSNGLADGSAPFFGIEDATAADITELQISTYRCAHGTDTGCTTGFAISGLQIQDNVSPEPASLLLLGSGLGILGLLRRKRLGRT